MFTPQQEKLATIGMARAFKKHLDMFESKVKARYPTIEEFSKQKQQDPKAVQTDIELLQKGRAQLKEMYGKIGINTSSSPSSGSGNAKA